MPLLEKMSGSGDVSMRRRAESPQEARLRRGAKPAKPLRKSDSATAANLRHFLRHFLENSAETEKIERKRNDNNLNLFELINYPN